MNNRRTQFIAGMSTSPAATQIVVMRVKDGERRIVHAEEFPREDESEDLWFLEPLLAKKPRWFRKVTKVCMALENSSVVLHNFPLDLSLSQVERNAQVQWELENFLTDYRPKDHVTDVHLLAPRAHKKVADALVVSAKRAPMYHVQLRLAQAHIDLDLVETDLLAARQALVASHPEIANTHAMLISVAENRMDAAVLYKGQPIAYRYLARYPLADAVALVNDLHSAYPSAEAYVYGQGPAGKHVDEFKRRCKVNVSRLNPFRNLKTRLFFSNSGVKGLEHHFVSSIGIALGQE
jgi:hypothetical protein